MDFIWFWIVWVFFNLSQSMQNRSFSFLFLIKGAAGVGDPHYNKKGEGLHAVSDTELYCTEHLSI